MSDHELEEEALAAYRQLIERAAGVVAEAAAESHDDEPELAPEPCP